MKRLSIGIAFFSLVLSCGDDPLPGGAVATTGGSGGAAGSPSPGRGGAGGNAGTGGTTPGDASTDGGTSDATGGSGGIAGSAGRGGSGGAVVDGSPGTTPDAARQDGSAPDAAPLPSTALSISPTEAVTRLARFLWKMPPDQRLMAQAAAGRPATTADVRQLVGTMLADPPARNLPADFVVWWLRLDRLNSFAPDPVLFPSWNPGLRDAMLTETRTFVTNVTYDEQGTLATLLSAPFSYANALLSAFYVVPGPVGAAFQKVSLNPTQRAGLVTQAAVLASTSLRDGTSPTHRGELVRTRLLCQQIPPPPPMIPPLPPRPPTSTRRQQYQVHISSPACAGCHNLMDPIGFGLENYDGLGRHRTTENGMQIDASGQIAGSDLGSFVGGVELATRLAMATDVRRCFADRWLEYALGRPTSDADARSIDAIVAAANPANWRVTSVMTEVAASAAFLAP